MQRICAVLVTHNRASLLRETLLALRGQVRPPSTILLVDNASTDATPDMLARQFPSVVVLRMPQNIGGAGGYRAGIDWAATQCFDWIWTLDDDSVPQPDALAALLRCREQFDPSDRPDLLASKVVWTDGSLHPMNIPKPKLYDPRQQFAAAENAAMSIRFTSFVSLLLHRRLVEAHGLPLGQYFIWNDDVEYTGRILRHEFGVMVPASVVVHKTAAKSVPAADVGNKFFYEVRNKLWIARRSRAFDRGEKWWMMRSLARRTWRHLREVRFERASVGAVLRGISAGMGPLPPEDASLPPAPTARARAA
jgi:GT2 family glycosyltransferase